MPPKVIILDVVPYFRARFLDKSSARQLLSLARFVGVDSDHS